MDSAIDAFFLEIQGSGRVRLDDGSTVRMAFADVNGRPYRAIGRYLVDRGEMTLEQATAPALRDWLQQHPDRQQEVFNQNPSVVFFREEKLADPARGTEGCAGRAADAGALRGHRSALAAAGRASVSVHHRSAQRRAAAAPGAGAGHRRRDSRRHPRRSVLGLGRHRPAEAAGRMRAQGSLWLLWPADQPLPAPALPARIDGNPMRCLWSGHQVGIRAPLVMQGEMNNDGPLRISGFRVAGSSRPASLLA